MTCIVGYKRGDRVWIGGDAIAADSDGSIVPTITHKVWSWEDFVFGAGGSWRGIQIMQAWLFDDDLLLKLRNFDGSLEDFMVTYLVPTIREIFDNHGYSKRVNDQVEMESTFLIGVGASLFYLQEDYAVLEVDGPFYATGSGHPVALGAMHVLHKNTKLSPKTVVIRALEAAQEFNAFVRPPFTVIATEAKEPAK